MAKRQASEVARLRQAIGQTQKGLAEKLRVNIRTFQRWEAGEAPIPYATLELLKTWAGRGSKP